MEGKIKYSALRLKKPERKVTEKNRRNQMKFLFSHLFSLIPPHLISKGGCQASDRVDIAIEYIQMLKTNLEINKNNKEKLLSRKRSHEQAGINNICKSLYIQIHEMSHDHDAVLVTGIKNHSSFCNVVQLLNQYSMEVTLANFSITGHSTFHIRHKKIEADEISKRVKMLLEQGYSDMKELRNNYASSSCNQLESNLSVWDSSFNQLGGSNLSVWDFDFDFESNVWGWELETDLLPMNIPVLEEY